MRFVLVLVIWWHVTAGELTMIGQEVPNNVQFAGYSADFRFHRSTLCLYRLEQDGERLVPKLGKRALGVLNLLIEGAPETVPESVLLGLWGPNADARSRKRNLDVQIKNLRRVLEEGATKDELGCVIRNAPRRGYCFNRKLSLPLDETHPPDPPPGPRRELSPEELQKLIKDAVSGAIGPLEERLTDLSKRLDVSPGTAIAILRITDQHHISLERIPEKLAEITGHYKSAMEQLAALDQQDAVVLDLVKRAKAATNVGRLDQSDHLLSEAEQAELAAADQLLLCEDPDCSVGGEIARTRERYLDAAQHLMKAADVLYKLLEPPENVSISPLAITILPLRPVPTPAFARPSHSRQDVWGVPQPLADDLVALSEKSPFDVSLEIFKRQWGRHR